MTKLDAVNDILAAIGEDPVNSLNDGLPDADLAKRALDRILVRTQTRGWWFNREPEARLYPNVDGHIEMPTDVLDFHPIRGDANRLFSVRGGTLYDRKERTDEFGEPVDLYLVRLLDWEDLPQVFTSYVITKAARHFQDNRLGSQTHHQYQKGDEQEAYAMLMEKEVDNEPANMTRDSHSTMDIAGRFRNPSPYLP